MTSNQALAECERMLGRLAKLGVEELLAKLDEVFNDDGKLVDSINKLEQKDELSDKQQEQLDKLEEIRTVLSTLQDALESFESARDELSDLVQPE